MYNTPPQQPQQQRAPQGQNTMSHDNHDIMSDISILAADNTPAADGQWADINWGLVTPKTLKGGGILTLYNLWKPWIHMLHPYSPPSDLLHVILSYDRKMSCIKKYSENNSKCTWTVESRVVGPEGVATAVTLTEK